MRIAAYVTGLVVAFLVGVWLARLVVWDVVYVRGDENHGS
jgi:hypothetical protein